MAQLVAWRTSISRTTDIHYVSVSICYRVKMINCICIASVFSCFILISCYSGWNQRQDYLHTFTSIFVDIGGKTRIKQIKLSE